MKYVLGKYVFVRYDVYRSVADGGTESNSVLIKGEAGESVESCEKWIQHKYTDGRYPVKILCRFEIPDVWDRYTEEDNDALNRALDAVTGLDALTDTPLATDLLGAIFMEGFTCGMKFESDLQSAFSRGRSAAKK